MNAENVDDIDEELSFELMEHVKAAVMDENYKMSAEDVDDIDEELPFELMEHAKAAVMDLLPQKSLAKYNRAYDNFKRWQNGYGVTKISSKLILAYFHMLNAKKYKPTTLWAVYSMLKATLRSIEDIHIGNYPQVSAFLKKKIARFQICKGTGIRRTRHPEIPY